MNFLENLLHGKYYMVKIADGSSPRICKWNSRSFMFFSFGDPDMEVQEVAEVRGPIIYESLPVVGGKLAE